MIGISEKRTPAQAVAECSRHRASLKGWRSTGVLQFDRNGCRIAFRDGYWILYSNNLLDRYTFFCSSYLIAVIDAAKEL